MLLRGQENVYKRQTLLQVVRFIAIGVPGGWTRVQRDFFGESGTHRLSCLPAGRAATPILPPEKSVASETSDTASAVGAGDTFDGGHEVNHR